MATVDLGAIRFNWKGAYSGGTAYVVDDVVSSGGSSYMCIQAHAAGTQAVSVTAYWSVMAEGGDVATTLTTQGDVLFRDGSGLQRLAKGTAGQALKINAGATAPEWGGVTAGLSTIWVPANAMTPTDDAGCEAIASVPTQAGRPDMIVLDFPVSADKFAQFQIAFPKSWNEGTITYQVYWCSTAADTDAVNWTLQGVSVPDNSTIDVAYGGIVDIDENNQGAAEEMLVSAVSGALTIASAAADTVTFFRIGRDVSEGNAAEAARLLGVKLFFTTNAENDA